MAVTAPVRVELLPWRGFDDPAFPSNAWIAQRSTDGDASGGNIANRIIFQLATDALSARLYNIEQLHISQVTNAVIQAQIEIVNMGHLAVDRALTDYRYALALNAGASAGGISPSSLNHPLFLGAPNMAGAQSHVGIEIPNAGAGETLIVTAWGYVWEPRSILAPGGLQRPLGSPFGG